MSIAYGNAQRYKIGNAFLNTVRGTISADDEYPKNGYVIRPADAGLQEIFHVQGVFSTGHVAVYDGKIRAMASGAEINHTDNTDKAKLQSATIDLVVLGR